MQENDRKIRILLTGASGTVGSEVLRQLIDNEDIELTVFDLKTPRSEKIFKPYLSKAQFVYGNISKREDVDTVSKNKDVVIHLAAVIPPLADEKPELAYRVNVKGTENLLNSFEIHSPDAFFMYSSSVSVYGDRVENPNIRVGDPLTPSVGDEYAKTKLKCEELVQKSAMKWTIFRLGAIMKNHEISKLMFHMPLNTTMEICTPEDTARAFVNGIGKQAELTGKIFNLGGGKQCTTSYEDFLQRSFKLFGLGKLNFAPNAFATKNFHCGYFADGHELEEILHFRNDNLESYFTKTKKDISPIIKFFGTIFRYPIKKYLQSTSEPLQALKNNDREMIERFFGKKVEF
ncbi:MAG: NAD(P)-dependent oxidoreductase [Porphyromonadaceae bacterium]|jgi:nucleoside-diphosphate-sugar epimerase|nr:NAD(P)-dependent oxidoreductase [Porphyromonadaceae bacterium]